MTEPKFPTLTDPAGRKFYCYPYDQQEEPGVLDTEFVSGHDELSDEWELPLRTFYWIGKGLREADADYVMAFLRECKGTGFYVNSLFPIWSPWAAPTLSTSAGGALGARTYYVRYSWGNGTVESRLNGYGQGSQVCGANTYLTVTPKPFPVGITEARIYIGTVSGTLYYSGKLTTDSGTWTQDGSATTVGGQSNSGQTSLIVAATTGFQVGGVVLINSGGAREEVKIIASIIPGSTLIMTTNLTYTHTLAEGDAVATVVGNASGGAVPTANSLTEQEVHVKQMGPWRLRHRGRVYDLSLDLREIR